MPSDLITCFMATLTKTAKLSNDLYVIKILVKMLV